MGDAGPVRTPFQVPKWVDPIGRDLDRQLGQSARQWPTVSRRAPMSAFVVRVRPAPRDAGRFTWAIFAGHSLRPTAQADRSYETEEPPGAKAERVLATLTT